VGVERARKGELKSAAKTTAQVSPKAIPVYPSDSAGNAVQNLAPISLIALRCAPLCGEVQVIQQIPQLQTTHRQFVHRITGKKLLKLIN